MRKGFKFLTYFVIAFIFLCSMAFLFQEKLIFLPSKLTQDYNYTFDFPFEEIFLNSDDGARLNALHLKVNNPKGVILYFHGNAGDLSRWGTIAQYFTTFQYDVIVMDYRTYGKSTGAMSEDAMYADAELFYEFAKQQYAEDQIIVYGRSLGTGLATYLASKNTPKKLLLETPYYSILDIAKKRFPILPVSLLLKYKFQTNQFIAAVSCPITIFHGTDDGVVAYASGMKLGRLVPDEQLDFITIDGGTHNNLGTFKKYRKSLSEALK